MQPSISLEGMQMIMTHPVASEELISLILLFIPGLIYRGSHFRTRMREVDFLDGFLNALF